MSDLSEETQETAAGQPAPDETQPSPAAEAPQKTPWVRLLVFGWLILIAVALLGGYSGYQNGLNARLATQAAETNSEIEQQFQLGLEDFSAGECDRARQRFEWVLEQAPDHEGAIDGLARAISCMNATATPTPATPTPTPTASPTPDLRSREEKFTQAQQAMAAGDWDAAIDSLFALRKEDPEYQAVEVDSMLYVAYRNRGVDKVLVQGELESGLYDLSQAELFGPLDSEANGYRDWARLYLIGASFYSVQDWAQASFYLGQVAPFAPNLHNGSSGFAMNWYLDALEKYINQLVEAKDWCRAADQVGVYKQYVDDPALDNQQDRYQQRCDEE